MPDFFHRPVLMAEVLDALRVKPGGSYVDGTIGGGGHAEAILAASSPTGWLYGCDRDGDALEAATRRLAPYAGRFEMKRGNYSELSEWVPAGTCDGVLLDLGVSSPQLDRADRGFSFQQEGPLDMRMDTRQSTTAATLVNSAEPEELAQLFWEYGGEPESRRIARAIVSARAQAAIHTTTQLAEIVECVCPRRGRKTHPATRVFQALRIAVNEEIGSLRVGLAGALRLLRPGGRLAVITFHSLEDRVVKEFSRDGARDYTFAEVDVPELRQPRAPELRIINRKAIKPSEEELAHNPRSRSAQLRVVEKLGHG